MYLSEHEKLQHSFQFCRFFSSKTRLYQYGINMRSMMLQMIDHSDGFLRSVAIIDKLSIKI